MRAVQSGGRYFGERLEGRGALFGSEGTYSQPGRLMRECLRHPRMRMAEACDRYTCEKVDVGVAVGVGEGRAFAVIECEAGEQRDSLASGRDIFLFEVEDLFRLGSRYCSLDRGKFSVGGCSGLQGIAVRILL